MTCILDKDCFKLKHLDISRGKKKSKKLQKLKDNQDEEIFMQELEEDVDLRSKINLFQLNNSSKSGNNKQQQQQMVSFSFFFFLIFIDYNYAL